VLVAKVRDRRGIPLCSWSENPDEALDVFADQEVMALTDENGFIPGQIYYSTLSNPRNDHGEFITGVLLFSLVSPFHLVFVQHCCFFDGTLY